MKTRNFFVTKLIVVTMILGLFSPSIMIEKIESPLKIISEEKTTDLSQGLLAGLSASDISISLFTQAEARRGRGMARRGGRRAGRRAGRRSGRRSARRANYRRGGGYYGRPYVGGAVVGGVVAGAAIGAAASTIYTDSCPIVYVRGLRYQDCGDGLIRY